MKLSDALKVVNEASRRESPPRRTILACGFTPLALSTFLQAHLQLRRPEVRVELETGLYGDLCGTLAQIASGDMPLADVAVIVEWSDLDARLSWRSTAQVGPDFTTDVAGTCRAMIERLLSLLERVAHAVPVVLCGPTLPIQAVLPGGEAGASRVMLQLRALAAELVSRAVQIPNCRVVDADLLGIKSPAAARADIVAELATGFPYHREHAAVVGELLAAALAPAPLKKGIITDLDNTLWQGIVGEIGVSAVSWDQHDGAHGFALYQRCLDAMAASGVLVAIASKNDPTVVSAALDRDDLLLSQDAVFPVEVGWGVKSAAVARILEAWNVGADSVIFLDDSPLEIAEVQSRFPGIEGIVFDGSDLIGVTRTIARLRNSCGKEVIRDEDRLRAQSLRSAAVMREAAVSESDEEAFLSSISASIQFDLSYSTTDGRALELINKTNQFTLNGVRFTPQEFAALLAQPHAFLLTVSYEDKFGPLGKIGALTGRQDGTTLKVSAWVMSCRAFSRRIEHATLRMLLEEFRPREIEFDLIPTDRNAPLQAYVSSLAPHAGQPVRLDTTLITNGPTLYHTTAITRHAIADEGSAAIGTEATPGSDRR
jgi:FkbH-like protein